MSASGKARIPVLPLQRLRLGAAIVVGASLPHWLMLPLWIPITLVITVSWRLLAARRGWALPRRSLRVMLAAAALVGVLAQFRTINGPEAGGALLIVMVGLKFVEARTHRDELVIMMLAYFIVFTSLLTHQHPLIGAYLIAFVFITTIGLLQLARRGPLLPARRTTRLAGALLLKALPIMAVLFVLFPRLPGPLWALPADSPQGISGLSDSMSPGDVAQLVLSEEVAFRVEFASEAPPAGRLYWRGPVLSEFDGRTWARAEGIAASAPPGAIEARGAPVRYRMMLEPDATGWAFALDAPTEWSGVPGMRLTADLQLVLPMRRRGVARIDYTATSHVDYATTTPLPASARERLTRLPDGRHERTRALAADWVQRGLTERERVAAALAMIAEQPFYYTLRPAALGGDTVDGFLFDTREGYCEHYASAFAVLMRAAGVPSRVVLGFHGSEPNTVGGHHLVRQSNAHAWTEVWLDDTGWTRIDPTAAIAPERVREDALSARSGGAGRGAFSLGWWRTAQHAWDTLNVYWYAWVVGYGFDAQRMLLERIGLPGVRAAALFGAALIAVVLMLALYGLARRLGASNRPDRASRLYARAAARLARRGIAPPAPTEPPRAYAARVARAHPQVADEITAIVSAYLRARYEPDAGRSALAALEARVRAFRPVRAPREADSRH